MLVVHAYIYIYTVCIVPLVCMDIMCINHRLYHLLLGIQPLSRDIQVLPFSLVCGLLPIVANSLYLFVVILPSFPSMFPSLHPSAAKVVPFHLLQSQSRPLYAATKRRCFFSFFSLFSFCSRCCSRSVLFDSCS